MLKTSIFDTNTS